jgi:hypothetical protein
MEQAILDVIRECKGKRLIISPQLQKNYEAFIRSAGSLSDLEMGVTSGDLACSSACLRVLHGFELPFSCFFPLRPLRLNLSVLCGKGIES